MYFLDHMSWMELFSILKADSNKNREVWEKVRLECFYTVISTNGSKKIKKPTDLFKFEWDSDKPNVADQKPISIEEFNELAKRINII